MSLEAPTKILRENEPAGPQRQSPVISRGNAYLWGLGGLAVTAFLGLQAYSALAVRNVLVPPEVTAQLDTRAEIEALELRKEQLLVFGVPHSSTAADGDGPKPFSNEEHQRRIDAEFTDESTGLVVKAQTHLCLPGIDPCISGGFVEISDGKADWEIRFQLLGSTRNSNFQSSVPKSRRLLNQLEQIAAQGQGAPPEREEYVATLGAALGAEENTPEQQQAVRRLLQLLLTSYFASDDFHSTRAFAESHALIN